MRKPHQQIVQCISEVKFSHMKAILQRKSGLSEPFFICLMQGSICSMSNAKKIVLELLSSEYMLLFYTF